MEHQKELTEPLEGTRAKLKGLSPGVKFLLIKHLRLYTANLRLQNQMRHQNKLQMLAEKQSKPLCNVGDTVKVLDDLKVPSKFLEYLSLGPKHPILDKFNEIQFLVDIDGLLHNLNSNGASREKLDEVNALALWYNKEMKEQREDPMLNKVKKYLTKEKLKAVPFDKRIGFCVMENTTYEGKLVDILNGDQFEKVTKTSKKNNILAIEDNMNKSLRSLLKNGEIDDDLFKKTKEYWLATCPILWISQSTQSEHPTETCSVVAWKRLWQAQ